MAVVGTGVLTLMDLAKRLDPNDGIAKIIELVSLRNEVLADMLWMEGNLLTGHKTTVRVGYSNPTWRLYNIGTQPSKSETAQITDSCGMLTALSNVDKALADLNGNTAEFRLSEDMGQLEGMDQEMATTTFYGDTRVTPESFMGFGPRFSAISTDRFKAGYNVVDGGGRGNDNTSIWVVVWGANTVHGIYPKGSKAGWTMETFGQAPQILYDTQSPIGQYPGYRTWFEWHCGLTVRDWRYVCRIANIDYNATVSYTHLTLPTTERV